MHFELVLTSCWFINELNKIFDRCSLDICMRVTFLTFQKLYLSSFRGCSTKIPKRTHLTEPIKLMSWEEYLTGCLKSGMCLLGSQSESQATEFYLCWLSVSLGLFVILFWFGVFVFIPGLCMTYGLLFLGGNNDGVFGLMMQPFGILVP